MRTAKDLIGKPIISIGDGRQLGIVKDLYLDRSLNQVSGIFLGSEGVLGRKKLLMERNMVLVFGADAILAKSSDAISDSGRAMGWPTWLRRDRLQGVRVATAGGTRVGTIDDVLLDSETRVVGFSLSRVFVKGPVEENRAIAREAVVGFDDENDLLTIDLAKAERQSLRSK